MLGLSLREEFRGRRLKGTAIELSNDANTGATQVAAKSFLDITYPTHDLLKGIEAVGPNQGRPVVVIGERGLGKSHLLAALYHAVNDTASTSTWLQSWANTLNKPEIGQIALRKEMKAQEWSGQSPDYRRLHVKYQSELRDHLKKRFDRFAVLQRWDYVNPSQCRFSIEALKKQGAQIPEAIEEGLINEVFLMEPTAVPSTGGIAPPEPQPTAESGGGGQPGGGTTPTPHPNTTELPTGGQTTPNGGGIFGGGSSGGPKPRITCSNPPTSPVNLIGKLESWGIGPATPVAAVSIRFSTATGAQLKELLKKLPDGMTFEIRLEKEDT